MDVTEGDFDALRGALLSVRRLSQFPRPEPERVAAVVSQALLGYLFDCADAATDLLEHGHAEQSALVIRAMLSSAATLRVVWKEQEKANGVALQYLLFSQRFRTRRFETLVAQLEIDRDLALRLDAEEQAREAELLLRLKREHGIEPIKLGPRSDTWSGLNDKALIVRAWGGSGLVRGLFRHV